VPSVQKEAYEGGKLTAMLFGHAAELDEEQMDIDIDGTVINRSESLVTH
jgi:hypothetical protein